MNDADKKLFNDALVKFGAIHKEPVSPERRLAYWEVLQSLTRIEFERAAVHLMATHRWFPKPADFIQAAKTVGWI